MARPVTLFTGQWADLPLAELAAKCGALATLMGRSIHFLFAEEIHRLLAEDIHRAALRANTSA